MSTFFKCDPGYDCVCFFICDRVHVCVYVCVWTPRYAALASWLSQTVQVLAGVVGGVDRDQAWYVLFTLFATYTLLPLPLLWSISTGVLTAALHLLVDTLRNYDDAALFRKVSSLSYSARSLAPHSIDYSQFLSV